jgi:hypothetical protein
MAVDSRNQYDATVAILCSSGCTTLPPTVKDDLSRMRVENAVAISLFVVGGTAFVGGLVAAMWNEPRPVHSVAVVPTRGGALLSLAGSF